MSVLPPEPTGTPEARARALVLEHLVGLDALLQHAPIAFAFVDLELRFVQVNQPMADLVGIGVEAHAGRRLDEVESAVWRECEPGFHSVLLNGDPVIDAPFATQTAVVPGLERHFLTSFYPVRASDGSMLGVGSVLVEVTEGKQSERAALLLSRASELLAGSLDVEAILDEAVHLAIPEFADSCHLYLEAERGAARRVAIAHVVPEIVERLHEADRRWPLDPDVVLGVDTPARSVLLTEVSSDLRRKFIGDDEHLAIIEEHGVVSAILAPLITRGRRLGLLVLNYTTVSGRRYRRPDVPLAEELARRFAQAIDGARLAAQTTRVRGHVDLLARTGELLTVELESDTRMRRFVGLVVPDFADMCVMQEREDDGSFTVAHFAVADPRLEDRFDLLDWPGVSPHPLMPSVRAVETRRPVLLSRLDDDVTSALDPQTRALIERLAVRSVLTVPLLGESDTPFGTITFVHARSGRRYEPDDIPIAQELARRIGHAFENARRFERERTTAETLQLSLLPARLPDAPDVAFAARYRPGSQAHRVGGDWYDVISRPDGRLVMAVGDVVGHGLAAASSTGRLRAGVALSALDGLGAAATLERLNRYLTSLDDAEMATVVVMVLDPATGELTLSSAGHPPPVVISTGSSVSLLTGGLGVPLRVVDDARYEEITISLDPDDALLVYTDGLIERRDESIDAGLERLLLGARDGPHDLEALADHLLDRLLPPEGPSDDVALLLLRSIRRPARLELELRARPEDLGYLRRRLREWLAGNGVPEHVAEEVVVAVNEAAANAVEHAYAPAGKQRSDGSVFVATGHVERGEVVIEIRDTGAWRPGAPDPNRGRGLSLMRRLTDDVRIDTGAAGTTVRLRRRIDETPGPMEDFGREEPARTPGETPGTRPGQRPVESPVESPVERPVDRPAERPAEREDPEWQVSGTTSP